MATACATFSCPLELLKIPSHNMRMPEAVVRATNALLGPEWLSVPEQDEGWEHYGRDTKFMKYEVFAYDEIITAPVKCHVVAILSTN